LSPEVSDDAARAAHDRVADVAKVRVTSEISQDASSNVIYRKELQSRPRCPTPPELDNIALRREIGRLRHELGQQLAAQAAQEPYAEVSELQAAKLELERERAVREATIQRLRRRLARRSFTNKIRRFLGISSGTRAIAV
jgi:hypothetical protein